MTKATASCVAARLPKCLSCIVMDYFGRYERTMYETARQGHWEECMIYMGNDDNDIIYGAFHGGHQFMAEFMMARHKPSDYNINVCLLKACQSGDINTVNLAIYRGADDWNYGLIGACRNGRIDIAGYMIARGATCIDKCLIEAAENGHLDICEYLITLGAQRKMQAKYAALNDRLNIDTLDAELGDFSRSLVLLKASADGRLDIMEKLTSTGNDDLFECLEIARIYKSQNIVEFLLARGVTDIKFAKN